MREVVRPNRTHVRAGVLALAMAALAVLAPAASADLVIGQPGSGAGQYDDTRGVAVDDATGNVYVPDRTNKRVDVFDSAGNFIRAFGWDVIPAGQPGDTGTKLESCTTATTCKAGSAGPGAGQFGSSAGQFNGPSAIEVDNTGSEAAVYVADEDNHRVQKFDAEGHFILMFGKGVNGGSSGNPNLCTNAGPPTDICGAGSEGFGVGQFKQDLRLAVGPGGVVYVGDDVITGRKEDKDTTENRVQEFASTGALLGQFAVDTGNFGRIQGLAVDSVGDIYIATNGSTGAVRKLDAGGAEIAEFHSSTNIQAITVDSSDSLFVGDRSGVQTQSAHGSTGAIYEYDATSAPASTFYGSVINVIRTVGLASHHTSAGDIFAAEPGHGAAGPVFGRVLHISFPPPGPVVVPESTTAPEAEVRSAGATLEAALNPEGKATTYHFEYVDATTYQADVQAEGPAHGFDHAVSTAELTPTPNPESPGAPLFKSYLAAATATGLAPETTYHFRVVAEDSDGNVTDGPEGAPFTTLDPLQIEATWATDVGTDAARLHAEVNPLGTAAGGYFEYVDETTYQADVQAEGPEHGFDHAVRVPAGTPIDFGSGEAATARSAQLYPLTADTPYRYRVVAKNHCKADPEVVCTFNGEEQAFRTFPTSAPADTSCPNQTFRTGLSALLPDCRAYEMVSSLDKNNSDITVPQFGLIDQSTPDGEALTFATRSAFAEPLGAPANGQFIARRNAGAGWSTHSINAPRKTPSLYFGEGLTSLFKAFSEDLCSAWMVQDTSVALSEEAPPGMPNLYRREDCGAAAGKYELLPGSQIPGFDPAAEKLASSFFPAIQGLSADGGISVFRADAPLTPDASTKNERIFQIYARKKGQLHLISVLPNGKANPTHSTVGTAQSQGEALGISEDSLYHAVSRDGSRVFWTATDKTGATTPGTSTESSSPGTLYLRVNAEQEQSEVKLGKCTEVEMACTLKVSELASSAPASFVTADTAGSAAIFTIGEDLYEFTAEDDEGTLKTQASLIAHKVVGVLGAGDDATRVYFASGEVLSGEANGEGEVAQAGKPNLYLYQRGSGFTFVATLSTRDTNVDAIAVTPSPISRRSNQRTSRVSPDGLHAVFNSLAPLTGYDNNDAVGGEPDAEVYRFDATAGGGKGGLLCVSCNPSGARPRGRIIGVGGGEGEIKLWVASSVPVWTSHLYPGRALSEDGNRLFFESFDGLVPADTNGARDIYEWEAPGTGGCTELSPSYFQANGGCLSLISSGRSGEDSFFIDASSTGSDVFFTTAGSLLPQDPGLIDIYDAREGGGFPPPSTPPPACEGEACQGAPAAPDDQTPASATFKGAGNVTEGATKPRCAKGEAPRKGRCVAKKHHKRSKHAGRRAADNNRGAQR